jgi:hypothetical protein
MPAHAPQIYELVDAVNRNDANIVRLAEANENLLKAMTEYVEAVRACLRELEAAKERGKEK